MEDSPDEPRVSRAVGSALAWNLANQALTQLISTGVFLLLAQRLAPAAFGLFALTLVFVDAFATEARYAMTDALLTRQDMSRRTLSTALYAAGAPAVVIWGLLCLLSRPIAAAVDAPEVANMLPWLGLIILMAPLQVIFEVLALRDLAFGFLAKCNMAASVAAAAAALLALYGGAADWALVIQRVVLIAAGIMAIAVFIRWAPSLEFDGRAARELARPFAKLWFSQMVSFASVRAVDLIIGTRLGTSALGVYRVAARIVEVVHVLATRPLVGIFLPVLTRFPAGSQEQRDHYMQITAVAALISAPALAGLSLVAPELTTLLLGPQYVLAKDVLPLLALAGLVAPFAFFRGVALTAGGRPGAAAGIAAVEFVVLGGLVWLGAHASLPWAVVGLLVSGVAMAAVSAATVARTLGFRLSALLLDCAPPYAACLTMAAAVLGMRALLPPLEPWAGLAILVLTGATATIGHLLLLHRRWALARLSYLTGAI